MSLRNIGVLIATLTFSVLSFASGVSEKEYNSIEERIKPVGNVYLVGSEPVAEVASGPRTATSIYGTFCVACHGTGVSGAPIKGNADQWSTRIAQGMDVMTDHAINGFNAMPPKGSCMDCTDEEIVATINHMIDGI